MDTKNDPNAKKFSEPRSWAAKWCGHGLAGAESRPKAPKTNGKKFTEPRGWSAKWSGGGLFPGRKR
jgi:hypothetical protein